MNKLENFAQRLDDTEISRVRWRLSAMRALSNVDAPAPDIPLLILGPCRVIRCGNSIRFCLGSWLEFSVRWGVRK